MLLVIVQVNVPTLAFIRRFTALPSQAIKCKLNILAELDPKHPDGSAKCQWLAEQLSGQQLLCTVVTTEASTSMSLDWLFYFKWKVLI